MRLALTGAMCALSAPAAAFAEEDVLPDRGIVVTATIAPVSEQGQPFTVVEINKADLGRVESLAGALSELADVHVQMPGGRTGFASTFVRGADPNFTVTLLDGVPLNSPTNSRGGAVNLAEISSYAIDRAELLIGTGSTLFGSGPISAVLNLGLPAPARRSRLQLSGAFAGNGEATGAAIWRGPLTGGFGASLSAVVDDTGTWNEQSWLRSRSVDLRVAPGDGSGGRLLVHYADRKAQAFPDTSGGPDLAVFREVERRESGEWLLAVNQPVRLAEDLNLTLSGSWFERNDLTISPGIAPSPHSPGGIPAGEDDIHYRHVIGSGILTYTGSNWAISAGVQHQAEVARSEGHMDFGFIVPTSFRDRRDTNSLFAESTAEFDRLSVVAGIRLDDIEGIGAELSGRLAARLALTDDLAVRTSYGTGFKAPSFYAILNPFVGNRDLRPESGEGLEAAIEWKRGSSTAASLTAFRTRYSDLIDFIPADPPRLENRSRVVSEGVVFSIDQRLGAFTATGQIAYVKTIDATTNEPLLNRPKWRGTSGVKWQVSPNVHFAAHYAFTSRQLDFAVPVGVVELDQFGAAYAQVSYGVGPSTQVAIRIDNAFDSPMYEASGYPGRPRRARLSLTHTFE